MKDPEKLAKEHVDWFLTTIRPLLITHFIHGYKHGKNDRNKPIKPIRLKQKND